MAANAWIGMTDDPGLIGGGQPSTGIGGLPLQRSVALPSPVGMTATMDLTPQEQNLYQHHLTNIQKHKGTKNADGSVSTIRSITVERDGRQYMIPTVWDGKILDNQAAVKKAASMGWNYWPSYSTDNEAETRYMQMHDIMAPDVVGY